MLHYPTDRDPVDSIISSLPTSGACWIVLFIYHFVYPQMCTHEFPQDQFLT